MSVVALATLAYVLGWTAHVTFIFYLAPVALRLADAADRDAWVFAGTALASIATALPAGRLADAWPRRRVVRLGLCLLGLAYAPLLDVSLASVLLATALTGTGLALLTVAFNAYLADLLAAPGMSAAYGRTSALGILAGAAGPFIAAGFFAVLPPMPALRVASLVFGVGALLGAAVTLALPRAARHPPPPDAEPPRGARAAVAAASATYLLVGMGSGMATPYFAVYFLDSLGVAEATWGVILGFATAAGALGPVLVGRLGRSFLGARLLIAPQALHATVSLAFLAPLSVPMLAVAFVARNLFALTVSPTLNALVMTRVSPGARGRAQAWSTLSWNVGWAGGAFAGAAALAAIGGGAFVLGAALALAGVSAGGYLLSRR